MDLWNKVWVSALDNNLNIDQNIYCHGYSVIKLPYTDGSSEFGDYDDPSTSLSRMSNPLSSTSVKMTRAAIAGIDIRRLKSFIPGETASLRFNAYIFAFIIYKHFIHN